MLAHIPAIQPVANKNLKRMASGYGYRIHPVYKTKKVVWIIFTGNDLHNLREEKTSQLSAYLNASFTQSLFDNSEKVNEKLTDFLEKQISDSNVRMEKGLPLIRNEGYGESLDLIAAQNIETFILNEVAERIFEEVIKLETELAIVIQPP